MNFCDITNAQFIDAALVDVYILLLKNEKTYELPKTPSYPYCSVYNCN